jgi:hypothetical protein
MDRFCILALVKDDRSFERLTSGKNIESPLGEGSRHLNSTGSTIYGLSLFRAVVLDRSIPEHKGLNPVKSRRRAFYDLLTRREPKLKLYGNFNLMQGSGVSQFSLVGVGG